MQTREERRTELKQLARTQNGIDKLFLILTRSLIPFAKLPIGTLMIEAVLDHDHRLVSIPMGNPWKNEEAPWIAGRILIGSLPGVLTDCCVTLGRQQEASVLEMMNNPG